MYKWYNKITETFSSEMIGDIKDNVEISLEDKTIKFYDGRSYTFTNENEKIDSTYIFINENNKFGVLNWVNEKDEIRRRRFLIKDNMITFLDTKKY